MHQPLPVTGKHLIEASAGTGKTYTITNLYLLFVLGRGGDALGVDNILVLTFTVAATQELRARIRRRIEDARTAFMNGGSEDEFLHQLVEQSQDASRDRQLLTAASQLMDEASIFTIHGFCARVLADHAFATATLFDQPLDADRDELLEQAVRDTFRADIMTLPPLQRRAALGLWRSPDQLSKAIKAYLFRPALALVPAEQVLDEAQLVANIKQAKQRWISEDFAAAIAGSGVYKNRPIFTRLASMTAWCEQDNELDTDLWQYWTSQSIQNAPLRKGGQQPQHPLIELIDQIDTDLSLLRTNLWHLVFRNARRHLERYKQEQQQFTLDDLLTRLHQALTGSVAPQLINHLAGRWPVALIDEFQDTDDVQWNIFDQIYRNRGRGLFLIGDPKQAIYQFRGADVYTYINAKRTISSTLTLDTNWRSQTSLVQALNALFGKPKGTNLFGNEQDIPFHPVNPSPNSVDMSLSLRGETPAPICLARIEGEDTRVAAMNWAANEIANLLNDSAQGLARIEDRPLDAGQIALLVRDRHDARAARAALSARGIHSVYVTLESVFLTETADDLKTILQAILEPTNESAIRAALATSLMQTRAADIAALGDDLDLQQQTLREFADYHRQWAELDVATMIETMIARRQIAQKWFAREDGERQITNLRHLTELLQQRSAIAPGMHRLLKWFIREKREANTVAADERQLRLESDRDLVKIVTMHAAKGLEYDIVMIPVAAFGSRPRKNEPSLYHVSSNQLFRAELDISMSEEKRALAKAEQQEEDMRLLYVAMTRARYRCYLGIPIDDKLDDSALARVLQTSKDEHPEQLQERWQQPLFEVVEPATEALLVTYRRSNIPDELAAPRSRPSIDTSWRVHSYTGVAQMVQQGSQVAPVTDLRGFNDDETETRSPDEIERSRFTFPRGPRIGVALHTLMEQLDFSRPATDQLGIVDQCLGRCSLDETWRDVVVDWIDDITATPVANTRLSTIESNRRLDELEFHFSLNHSRNWLNLIRSAGYCQAASKTEDIHLSGMMNGFIDLVFEWQGRFYVVDYKSNHLGDNHQAYSQAAMAAAIHHHLYDLQYLVYTVALHRYLKTRIDGYRYETHFGGVAYLFLRGMPGSVGNTGVFMDLPEPDLVHQLSQALGGAGVV